MVNKAVNLWNVEGLIKVLGKQSFKRILGAGVLGLNALLFGCVGAETKTVSSAVDEVSIAQAEQKDWLEYDCDSLWEKFEPFETARLDNYVRKRLKRMGHGVPNQYYPTPFDFDNDGDREFIFIDDVGYTQKLGGQGSHIIIVDLPISTVEANEINILDVDDFKVSSFFLENIYFPNRFFKMASKFSDLPRFDRGRAIFGEIEDQTYLKINADTYETTIPDGMYGTKTLDYMRPYDILAKFNPADTLHVFCVKKL